MSEAKTKSIVVAGDVAVDWFSLTVPAVSGPKGGERDARQNWQRKPGTRVVVRPGGAFLQAELVAVATGRRPAAPVVEPAALRGIDSPYLRSYADLGLVGASKAQPKAKVLRVVRWGGFAGPAGGARGNPER